ncbi:hypothetical protein B0H10DRAFT_1968706 [Mycena sp. CBHHK59/15]|nr:hypothetical protein B0H10DRAFT_1968706 [Mycena sp. CBHHK59/15]
MADWTPLTKFPLFGGTPWEQLHDPEIGTSESERLSPRGHAFSMTGHVLHVQIRCASGHHFLDSPKGSTNTNPPKALFKPPAAAAIKCSRLEGSNSSGKSTTVRTCREQWPQDRDTSVAYFLGNKPYRDQDRCQKRQWRANFLGQKPTATDLAATMTHRNLGNATDLVVTVTVR